MQILYENKDDNNEDEMQEIQWESRILSGRISTLQLIYSFTKLFQLH